MRESGLDALASRWPTGGLRDTSLYTLLAGVMSAALAVATGKLEEDVADQAGVPESVHKLNESLGMIGIGILALTGYWGGDLIYTYGIGVITVMPSGTP